MIWKGSIEITGRKLGSISSKMFKPMLENRLALCRSTNMFFHKQNYRSVFIIIFYMLITKIKSVVLLYCFFFGYFASLFWFLIRFG